MIPFPDHRRASGVVEGVEDPGVFFGTAGFVETAHVRIGDVVREGDPLVTCSNDQMVSRLAQLNAKIAEARAVEAIVAASGVTRSVAERRLTEWQIANARAVRGERRAPAATSGAVAGACLAAVAALLAAMAAAVCGGMRGRAGDSALEIGAI